MKIEYVKGDLFTTKDKIILHGVNCQGVMGSGVAKIVKERYPKAFKDYYYLFTMNPEGDELLGSVNKVEIDEDRIILNGFTQEFYGRAGVRWCDYDAIASVIEETVKICIEHECESFAMPMIGSGLGGGKWSVIEKIVEEYSGPIQPKVYYL
jgi:O-acetyl-ADP-ribose deacetylase (regulator of RNase III)